VSPGGFFYLEEIKARTWVAISPPRIKDSPTRIAADPHCLSHSTSARKNAAFGAHQVVAFGNSGESRGVA
jgi:hypothetical protein